MEKTTRTFIAVALDSSVQEELKRIQDQLRAVDADVRWVKPQNIHCTLKFLGDVKSKKLKSIVELFPSFFEDMRAFPVTIPHLGAFPKLKQPRIIWADIEQNADRMRGLASRVENGLCQLGFPKEKKTFTAHITLGRVKSGRNQPHLGKALENFSLPQPIVQTVRHVVLYQSTLSSQGPTYEPLAKIELE